LKYISLILLQNKIIKELARINRKFIQYKEPYSILMVNSLSLVWDLFEKKKITIKGCGYISIIPTITFRSSRVNRKKNYPKLKVVHVMVKKKR